MYEVWIVMEDGREFQFLFGPSEHDALLLQIAIRLNERKSFRVIAR